MHVLLAAALTRGDEGRALLLSWDGKFSQQDPLGPRLLPYLYHRYRGDDLPNRLREALGGAYRRALLQGQARRRQCWDLLSQPVFAQQRWMLLKGAVLAEFYYQDWALRPMGDLDLLLYGAQRQRWLPGLMQRGWRLQEHHAHASSLIHPQGLALDLHDWSLSECRWAGVDDDFWQHARPLPLSGAEGCIPCPEHVLLHLCLHGSKRDGQASPWLLDAREVLVKTPTFDWNQFWESARRRRLEVAAAEALLPLQAFADFPTPPRGGRLRDRLYASVRRWPDSRGRHLLWDAYEHFRNEPNAHLGSYLAHLSQRWGVRSAWQFPLVLVFRALRELSHGPRSRVRAGPDWTRTEWEALRCCWSGHLPETWEDWLRQYPGVRRLSSYLGARIADPPTVVQLAQVYEERRWRVVAERSAEVLTALIGLDVLLPRGPALAEGYYPEPWQRHCHGLDLVLTDSARGNAEQRLKRLGYSPANGCWGHPGGFEVKLHGQLLPEPIMLDPEQRITRQVCGVEVQVLRGPELMVLLLAHGALQRVPLSWGLDLALVIHRERLFWPLVAPMLERAGLGLVCASLWDELQPLFEWNLELKRPPVPSQAEWEVLFRSQRRRGLNRRQLWKRLGQWEARARLLWWLLGR